VKRAAGETESYKPNSNHKHPSFQKSER
jgi:hypothetical protein